tara:strand:+ start:766 stop:1542 length:777 start_codon:yes stop_codon:yes gene_type:complete
MINRFIIAAAALFFTAPIAHATTIVNTGSDSGGFKAVLDMVGTKINHDFVQAGNPVVASTYFDGGDVLTMWSTEWPGDSEMPTVAIDDSTIVALQTYETIMCSRAFNSIGDMAGQTVKIATWGGVDAVTKFLNELGEANNVTFEIVPYDGSGGTTRGYLANDADTIFTIQTRQGKIEADGNCFAFSANGDLDFAFVDMLLAVNASEAIVWQARAAVAELMSTAEWLAAFEGTETYVVNDANADMIVNKVNAAIALNTQ